MLIMYPPEIEFFKKTSEFAVQLMFGLLILSLIFLIFNQTQLMFVGMCAAGFLAFYLKTASNSNMILPHDNNLPKVKLAHFNLSSFQPYDPEFKTLILGTGCEIISFQEYTPDWDAYISKELKYDFPYIQKMVRIDLFGMAIYSKEQIKQAKTFYYNEVPNLHLELDSGLQKINIITSYITPPTLVSKTLHPKEHLDRVKKYIMELNNPTIALGDFNQVYWTSEIKDFRDKTKMNNSRRNISPTAKAPYDHIFYSSTIECIKFDEIKDSKQNHLGIAGTFQTKTSVSNPAILRTIGFEDETKPN